MIGPLQGLFYDWAGESFDRVDADEQDWYAWFGGPCMRLGRERVVDPDQRVLPGVSDDGGSLSRGWKGTGGKWITGRSGIRTRGGPGWQESGIYNRLG
jgi:hypothetical protein